MGVLIDANALLWWLEQNPTLSVRARAALSEPSTEVWVSAVTVWEISIKQSSGRLTTPDDLEEVIASRMRALAITLAHGLAAGRLPRHHRDPFDRMLVAQARLEGLTIVTRDPQIARYDVPVLAA